MTIKDVLARAVEQLKNADIEAPVLEAGALLCYVLQCDKVFLYAHNDYDLPEAKRIVFFDLLKQRVKGKPFQYIVGQQEFMSLNFEVTPDVLIPRHDTEILVETVIQECRDRDRVNILDIGTGSGCIAVSLAHYIKECRVTAVDISEKILHIARLNASRNKVENSISFFIWNVLLEDIFPIQDFYYDIVVSNPPYISTDEIPELQKEVREYEPHIALDGGEDGLIFYRKIAELAPGFLKPGGLLAFEIGHQQSRDVLDIMRNKYHEIRTVKDLSGNDRVITGRLI